MFAQRLFEFIQQYPEVFAGLGLLLMACGVFQTVSFNERKWNLRVFMHLFNITAKTLLGLVMFTACLHHILANT